MGRVDQGHALVRDAQELAEQVWGGLGKRWDHTRAVAARAATATATAAVPTEDAPVLVAAAWLHDIGYTDALRRSTFHPVDGAWYLQDHRWPPLVTGLVAHHSGARFVAAVRGLTPLMTPFADPAFTTGALADALTYADQTTGPQGQVMDVEDRLTEMITRHGPDSPNARCHAHRAPALRAAVNRTIERLRVAR